MQKSAKAVKKVGAWSGFVKCKPELDRCLKTTAPYVCFVSRADWGRADRGRAYRGRDDKDKADWKGWLV